VSNINSKFTSQGCVWISVDATSTTSLFRLLDTNATFNNNTINRDSEAQTVFDASYATKLRLNQIGVGGVGVGLCLSLSQRDGKLPPKAGFLSTGKAELCHRKQAILLRLFAAAASSKACDCLLAACLL